MRRVIPLQIVFAAIAVAFWLRGHPGGPKSRPAPLATEERAADLKRRIAEQEVESARAVKDYAPASKNLIADIDSPAADILRRLPGVADVEVGVAAAKSNRRIVHLRDLHHVPKDLYTIDLKAASGRDLTADEIDRLHQQLLLEVELVQAEQVALLRCLIQRHGLKRVFCERFSPSEQKAYRDRIGVLRAMEYEQVPQLRRQLDEVRGLIERSTGERKETALGIEPQLVAMLDEHKHRLLEVGAAGRLLITGELEDVLPLEDAEALEQAKPVTPSGSVELDPVKVEARHDAQVKAATKAGPVSVIVLGGSHDLKAAARRLGGGGYEYLRVTTRRYREIADP